MFFFSTAEFVPEKNVVIIGTSFIGMNALCFLVYIDICVFTLNQKILPDIKSTSGLTLFILNWQSVLHS